MAATSDNRTLRECLSDFLMNPTIPTAINVYDSLQAVLPTFNVSLVDYSATTIDVKTINTTLITTVSDLMDVDWKDPVKIKQCSAEINQYQCYFAMIAGCGSAMANTFDPTTKKVTCDYNQFGPENKQIIEAVHNVFVLICSEVLQRQSVLKHQEQAQEQMEKSVKLAVEHTEQLNRTRLPTSVAKSLHFIRNLSIFKSSDSTDAKHEATINTRFSLNSND